MATIFIESMLFRYQAINMRQKSITEKKFKISTSKLCDKQRSFHKKNTKINNCYKSNDESLCAVWKLILNNKATIGVTSCQNSHVNCLHCLPNVVNFA